MTQREESDSGLTVVLRFAFDDKLWLEVWGAKPKGSQRVWVRVIAPGLDTQRKVPIADLERVIEELKA